MIGSHHNIFIMLYHQHTVADIAEVLQGCDEPLVVALVQPDAGLIQYISDALQLRSDLCGQPDTLALPPLRVRLARLSVR